MNSRQALIALLGFATAACGSKPQADAGEPRTAMQESSADTAAADTVLPRLWVYYGGDGAPFCLSLRDDGVGELYGGFVWHNPIRWHFDPAGSRLDLTLSHLTSDDYRALKSNLGNGNLSAIDSTTGTLTYMFDSEKPGLVLFGWIL